ncbi:MAG: hypothetical protein RI100_05980 [Nitrosarchaeum sp.]|jgi:hypothetical protein|uniref:hypothetical protein n=1 Tax=Nitrosarchaeum sp. TaxID=2026886 RepID=UPI002DEDD1C7|nr:hypothetical protein [Nitrosarchaeum sp.]
MTSQYVIIGIAVGVFIVGIGVGYGVLQSTVTPNYMQMTPQQMQQMMNDPNMMNQWHQTMMNNPNAMNQWMGMMMNDPQAMTQMHSMMMGNNQHMNSMMQPMMNNMMNDPTMRDQMMGMMMNNQGMMNSMMNNQDMMNMMMGNNMMGNNMMGNQMMGSGMMSGNMMGSPITQQSEVITTIDNIEKILDQVSSNYRNGDQDSAFSLATNAYLENYEYVEGAIAQKDRPLMEKIELMMRVDLRSMINNGDTSDNVDAKINSIKSELGKVKSLFQ